MVACNCSAHGWIAAANKRRPRRSSCCTPAADGNTFLVKPAFCTNREHLVEFIESSILFSGPGKSMGNFFNRCRSEPTQDQDGVCQTPATCKGKGVRFQPMVFESTGSGVAWREYGGGCCSRGQPCIPFSEWRSERSEPLGLFLGVALADRKNALSC